MRNGLKSSSVTRTATTSTRRSQRRADYNKRQTRRPLHANRWPPLAAWLGRQCALRPARGTTSQPLSLPVGSTATAAADGRRGSTLTSCSTSMSAAAGQPVTSYLSECRRPSTLPARCSTVEWRCLCACHTPSGVSAASRQRRDLRRRTRQTVLDRSHSAA